MATLERRVSDEVSRLEEMSREDLLEKWHSAYGLAPFKGARNATLVRGLAYSTQSKGLGGLKSSISKELLRIAKTGNVGMSSTKTSKRSMPKTQLGTQLVREWNGRTHTVHITDKGCVLNGVTYTSLSAAAKAITGAHWSGPRFFGVSG